MRILLESIPQISAEDIQKWKKSTPEERDQLLDKLIAAYNRPDLNNIKGPIGNNFFQYGIDPKKNKFIELLDKLKFNVTKEHADYFRKLTELVNSKGIDLSLDYLTLDSLYDRNMEDFVYTVTLFDTVNDRYKIGKYFKDTTEINEQELFIPGSDTIKPVGDEGDGKDTLYGTVESWSGEDGSNDASYDSEGDGYSLIDVLKEQRVSKDSYFETLDEWIRRYFNKAIAKVNLKNNDIDYYLTKLNAIFNTPENIRVLSEKQLRQINRYSAYSNINDIPTNENKTNNVVYLNTYTTDNGKKFDNVYVIYNVNEHWRPYKSYLDAVKTIKAHRETLLNTKTIDDTHDKIIIVAGILEILSKIQMRRELL